MRILKDLTDAIATRVMFGGITSVSVTLFVFFLETLFIFLLLKWNGNHDFTFLVTNDEAPPFFLLRSMLILVHIS